MKKYTKADLEELLKWIVCKKGCGEVEIETYGYGPVCSRCGEELEGELTNQHCEYLEHTLKRKEIEE